MNGWMDGWMQLGHSTNDLLFTAALALAACHARRTAYQQQCTEIAAINRP